MFGQVLTSNLLNRSVVISMPADALTAACYRSKASGVTHFTCLEVNRCERKTNK